MKKFLTSTAISSSLLLTTNSVKADFDHYSIKSDGANGIAVYECVDSTGTCNQKAYLPSTSGVTSWNAGTSYVDKENNLIIHGSSGGGNSKWVKYNAITKEITQINDWKDNYSISLQKKVIRTDSSTGITSIGENSLKLKETTNQQQMWGTNSSGEIVPINITNGSKLLINGRDIEQSINNVGALSAALTGLPTVPSDTTLACGLGTGTHGGDFAFSGGCASKVNEKLSINYAASMTMPGQDYAGDFEDTFSARAGFIWKLGKSIKPTQISMKAKEKIEAIISQNEDLKQKNQSIISQNEDLKQKNQSIISQNKSLLARLERLEKVALGESKSKDLATIKLP